MIRAVVAASLVFVSSTFAGAQDFPTRAIKVIVPYAAGGPTDLSARLLANALAKTLNQSVVVENVGGAGGSVGSARAATSEPDGYTLLFNNAAMGASPLLQPKLGYDPIKDLEPLGISSFSAAVLVGRPDFPVPNLPALVEYINSSNGNITFANSGPGGTSHLCQVLFLNAIGAKATSVSYRGGAPAITDLAAGRVDLLCDAAETAAPQIQAGRIKPFGITSIRRMSVIADVATLDEQGLTGFDYTVWMALFAPKKTPPAIVSRLGQALASAIKDPAYRDGIARLGNEIVPPDLSGASALRDILARDMDRWRSLLKGVPAE
jgi:tripartite-type tricarboxylate transporter receptor subunit TctC